MKGNLSRVLRSGVAMLLTLCMLAGFVPTAAFATAEEINYVSIGDSMANGYCFEGYKQGEAGIDFLNGTGVYGVDAYPDQFAAYLESTGATVNHTKLAVSALRAEDLNFLLGGREEPTDGWEDQVNGYTRIYDDEVLSAFYQDAVKKADVITLGVGNASFGAYMLHRVTDALGVFGASLDGDEVVDLEEALIDLDAEQKELILKVYGMLEAKLMGNVPAEMAEKYNLKKVCDIMAYTAAGFLLNYKGSLEQIMKLNPKAEIVLVGLMNTTYGMKVVMDDMPGLEGVAPLMIGDVMDELFNMLNAYMTGLPTAMQKTGKWTEAKFYYAEQPNPLFISQQFAALKANGWAPVQDGRLSGAIVRDRNIDAYNGSLREMIAGALGMNLPEIDYTDVVQYEADMASWNGDMTDWYPYIVDPMTGAMNHEGETKMSVAIYLGIEDAIAESCDTLEITLGGLEKLASGNLMDVFDGMDNQAMFAGGPEGIRNGLGNHLTSTDATKGLCKIYALFKVGNGMSVHPTPEGHDQIAKSVIAAYKDGYTAEDETVKNVKIVLDELYNLIQTYGPEVAVQVWAQWEEYGYVDLVKTSIDELNDMLEARYEYYTTQALPTIEGSVGELAAQKDALVAEVTPLKALLAAKKAELAEVIGKQEIGGVTAPDLSIDVQLGNNKPAPAPVYDCEVEGEGVQAELEAAIRDLEHAIATIEALIAAVEADIADLVALAEQITEKVAELEQTVTEVKAAAGDLKAAFAAIEEVLTNETTDAMVDTVVASFEAARATALAAANVLDLTMGTAKMMESDINGMIAKLVADAEGLYNKFLNNLPGCIEQIPEDGMMLIGGAIYALQMGAEKAQAEIQAKLTAEKAELEAKIEGKKAELEAAYAVKKAELEAKYEEKKAELEAEYGPKIEELEGKLAGLEEQIKAEIEAKYNEVAPQIKAEYEAKIAELEAKAAALEAELQAKLAEQAAAATEELRAALQPQIDRITADLNTVKADLEHAAGHLAAALEMAYEQAVAEITAAYEEAKAKLIAAIEELKAEVEAKIAEAKAALDAAVAGAKAELEAAIAAAKAELEAKIAEVKAAAEAQIEKVKAEVEAKIAELNAVGQAIVDALTATVEGIRAELQAVEDAIEGILNGSVEAVEDLKEALVALGLEGADLLVDHIVEQFNALLKTVTTADLFVKDSIKYVAIGDGTAATESYVEELTALLTAEANAKGVEKVEVVNGAKVGNTVADELANMTDVTGADLITIGFSNVDFLDKAVAAAMEGADLDWTAVVGAENVKYVEQVLDEVKAKIAEAGIEGEAAVVVNTAVEAYAYAATQYAVMVPQLVNQINAVNPEAVVVIVGMYNPMNGVAIALDENTSLEIGEYVDYLVKGVAVHGVAYAALTGNAIYVDAPAVQTVNTNTELSALDLIKMAYNKFETLYPSAEGDAYIAAQIAAALNIVVEEEDVLLGDADGNGVINTLDAMRVLKYYTGEPMDGEIVLAACDVDGENGINTVDALYILQYYTGDVTEFPAAK